MIRFLIIHPFGFWDLGFGFLRSFSSKTIEVFFFFFFGRCGCRILSLTFDFLAFFIFPFQKASAIYSFGFIDLVSFVCSVFIKIMIFGVLVEHLHSNFSSGFL